MERRGVLASSDSRRTTPKSKSQSNILYPPYSVDVGLRSALARDRAIRTRGAIPRNVNDRGTDVLRVTGTSTLLVLDLSLLHSVSLRYLAVHTVGV